MQGNISVKRFDMFWEKILNGYDEILHFVAEFTIHTLELIGISIIVFGSALAIARAITGVIRKRKNNIIIGLGRALALALEFKIGAEIVSTVIIRDLRELVVLATVIALRTVLALLIHWEIKSERRDERELTMLDADGQHGKGC